MNRQIQYLGCDRCKGDYFATHGVKLKDLTRVCECGSKDRKIWPERGHGGGVWSARTRKCPKTANRHKPATVDGPVFLRLGKVKRFGYPLLTRSTKVGKVRAQGRTASTAKRKAWSIYH